MNEEAQINWRRGFFRCWAVSSIIWVFVIGYIDFQHRPAYEAVALGNQNSSDCEINPHAGPWCNYQKPSQKYEIAAPDGAKYLVYVPPDLTLEQVMHFVALNQNVLISSDTNSTEGSNRAEIKSPTILWLFHLTKDVFSFPLLALLLLVSFTWVIHGFKKRPS